MELGHLNLFIGANGSGPTAAARPIFWKPWGCFLPPQTARLMSRHCWPGGFVLVSLSSTHLPFLLRLEHEFLPIYRLGPIARKQNIRCVYLQDDRVRLFTVSRTRSGRTSVRRVVVDQDLLEKAERGWSLSRLWVMGHLGSVPNV